MYKNPWEACDAEDCGFQMLSEDEVVTSVQEESDPVDDETDEQQERKVRAYTGITLVQWCNGEHLSPSGNSDFGLQNIKSNKMWWNNLKDLPMWSRRKAVAEFRLTTRHDCLLKHLHRIHVAQAPFFTLYDFREDIDADHIRRCPVLKGFSFCDLYWPARDLLGS
ncbi:hypothetical protein TNCV_2265151 [Trichonephila clavipes]|nr:hypothetical protein TNCV_2265151 [Trichonephila clavipes]